MLAIPAVYKEFATYLDGSHNIGLQVLVVYAITIKETTMLNVHLSCNVRLCAQGSYTDYLYSACDYVVMEN